MEDPGTNPAPSPETAVAFPEDDERWALVLRAAGSVHFLRAQQLREILLFVCQKTIADPSAVIREHEIGCKVLGRKPDFNTHEDTIVRVQFGHLRRKLDAYFTTEGRDEPIRIAIPKGSYVPRFEPYTPEAPPAAPALPPVPLPVAAPSHRRPVLPLIALGTLIALILVSALFLIYTSRNKEQGASERSDKRQDTTGNQFWSRMLTARQPLNVVVADTCLVMLQDILHTDIPLAFYLGGHYPEQLLSNVKDTALANALRLISSRQYSSLGDISTASKLLNLSRHYGEDRALIRYARHLSIREFQTGNFVLIGSRRGIPWVQLFEPRMNFSMEEDRRTHLYSFRNKSPVAGEQVLYSSGKAADGAVETFADIAFLPNLDGNGYVLILAGIGMEGAEAAGDLVSGNRFTEILSAILPRQPNPANASYFEILLKSRVVAGASNDVKVVAHRILKATQPGADAL